VFCLSKGIIKSISGELSLGVGMMEESSWKAEWRGRESWAENWMGIFSSG